MLIHIFYKYCSVKLVFTSLIIVVGSVVLVTMVVDPVNIITKPSTFFNARILLEHNTLREDNINPSLSNSSYNGSTPVLNLNYSNANYDLEIRKLRVVFWGQKFERAFKFSDQPDACEYTFDEDMVEQADFVYFHTRSLKNLAKLPEKRPIGQRWVLHTKESAKSGPYSSEDYLASLANIFNFSSHYSMSADIKFPYGWCEDVISGEDSRWPPVPNKTGVVMWVSSNCYPQSQRGVYVKQLKQYIPVDSYGKCGDQKLSRKQDGLKIYKRYKFCLAFENSFCKEYVTEKLYRILSDESMYVIPIVMGLDDYDMLPPGSIINIRDYSSPKLLAKHILYLNSNYKAFMKYFEWRKTRKCFLNTEQAGAITLCDSLWRLHRSNAKRVLNRNKLMETFGIKNNCVTAQEFYKHILSDNNVFL